MHSMRRIQTDKIAPIDRACLLGALGVSSPNLSPSIRSASFNRIDRSGCHKASNNPTPDDEPHTPSNRIATPIFVPGSPVYFLSISGVDLPISCSNQFSQMSSRCCFSNGTTLAPDLLPLSKMMFLLRGWRRKGHLTLWHLSMALSWESKLTVYKLVLLAFFILLAGGKLIWLLPWTERLDCYNYPFMALRRSLSMGRRDSFTKVQEMEYSYVILMSI